MSPRIVFTGGGTAGHVAPNIALIHAFQEKGWQMDYIGSASGIEKEMISPLNIPFHAVQSGKLRRYFSVKNFLDPFKILYGIVQSTLLLAKLRPHVVFSKGGFVAFPVVFAAWLNRIPVVAHESDMSPGLVNRLCFPFVNKICVTFEAAKKHFKNQDRVEVTGTPIREALFQGQRQKGLELCQFQEDKPCLLVIGGSLGAASINRSVRDALEPLLTRYQVIHLCGKGKVENAFKNKEGYQQFEYANEELAHFFAAADVVVSRSGANSLYEILALGKPHILIPLSAKISRGDQIQNANYFKQQGISLVIADEALNQATLLEALNELDKSKFEIEKKIKALRITSATDKIIAILEEQIHDQHPSVV